MFSLILAVIALVLVTLLALAAVYFGGNAFTQGNDQAVEAGLLNQAGTLQAAVQLYQNDNAGQLPPAASASQALIQGSYLEAWPTSVGTGWQVSNGYAVSSTNSTACTDMDLKLGISPVPMCSNTAYTNQTVCCQQ